MEQPAKALGMHVRPVDAAALGCGGKADAALLGQRQNCLPERHGLLHDVHIPASQFLDTPGLPQYLQEFQKLPVRETVLKQVQEALVDTVGRGTGNKARLTDITVAGKTGTSQVVALGKTRLKASQMKWNQRDHAWFVAFAPAEAPTIAIATLVEHAEGGGGAIAAPITKRVLQAYFHLQAEREGTRVAQN